MPCGEGLCRRPCVTDLELSTNKNRPVITRCLNSLIQAIMSLLSVKLFAAAPVVYFLCFMSHLLQRGFTASKCLFANVVASQ